MQARLPCPGGHGHLQGRIPVALLPAPIAPAIRVRIRPDPLVDEVIFHNGAQGSVRVVLDPVAQLPGFSAVLDKADLNANENAVLKLRYEPPDTDSRPQPATVRLKVEPFNQQFAITVK